MADLGRIKGRRRFAPALLAAAGLSLTVPGAVLAIGGPRQAAAPVANLQYLPFTPAKVDPALARQVERIMGAEALRFTPAANLAQRKDRTVTVAVRVDDATARALSLRPATGSSLSGDAARSVELALAPTRYNLGIARGYQSFAQPAKPAAAVSAGLRDIRMPALGDLADVSAAPDKPSRFQTRVALEQEDKAGRAPRTFEGLGDQSVDVAGSYRLNRNLNVTAGVRLSQERDRLAPLTDGVEDSKAVYVGTQIRF